MKDEFVAVEDAGATSQVGLFCSLVEMPQIPGFGRHESEQLLMRPPFGLKLRNKGVAAKHSLCIRKGSDQFIPATRPNP